MNENKKQKRGRPRRKQAKSKKSSGIPPSGENIAQGAQPSPTPPANNEKEHTEKDPKVSDGGSVLVERVNERLDAIRMSYKNSYAAEVEIPKKLQEYPNPREEKMNLVVHQQIIRETQTMLEGRPKPILRGPGPLKPTLETIPKSGSNTERGSEYLTPSNHHEPTQSVQFENYEKQEESLTQMHSGNVIPEVEELTARELRNAVRKNAHDIRFVGSPPFYILDFDKK